MSYVIWLLSVTLLSLVGCNPSTPPVEPTIIDPQYNYRTLPKAVAEEEFALDILENRLLGDPTPNPETRATTANTDSGSSSNPAEIATPEPEVQSDTSLVSNTTSESIPEPSGFTAWVLKTRAWLFFLAYCLVAIIAAWYTKATGDKSDTLQKIMDALDERMNFKQRSLFRILKQVWNKLWKKKRK